MTKYIALTINKAAPRMTAIGHILEAAASRGGTTVARRAARFFESSNVHKGFGRLARVNWIEPRTTGPRGVTWHATARGRYHLRKARAAIADARPVQADMLALLVEMNEFWRHGTPVHAGSLLSEEAQVLIERHTS